MVTMYIQKAKDRFIARELALLHASKPTPPMVSHLDEVDDAAIEEGARRVIEAIPQAAPHAAASAIMPPLSVPMCCSPSQASCDPEAPAMLDPSPSTSQASCDPEAPAMLDPSPSTSQASCYTGTVDQQVKRRRRRSVLRAPDPGCRNCQLLSAELNVVRNLLQMRNDELRQLHSSTMRATVSVVLFLWCTS